MKYSYSAALFAAAVSAQGGAWSQCGGMQWTGPTTCISGYSCVYSNPWYSQCLPGQATTTARTTTTSIRTTTRSTTAIVTTRTTTPVISTLTTTRTTSALTTTATKPAATGLVWLGVNESGAEFGEKNIPGTYDKDFTMPANSAIDTLYSQGYNTFRVPMLMERMAPGSITSSLSQAYLANYTKTINYITNKGGYAVIDPHNYGRYGGNIVTDASSFGSFWSKLAAAFKDNSRVIFDTNNEYHDMDQQLVFDLNQAAINAIRGAGATSQTIFVEGNSWSGAWHWVETNDNLKDLSDPQNKLVYEMHQYLDSDGSGTSTACVSSTIGAERVSSATSWLRSNGKKGIIGEFAGGANSQCLTAVKGLLDHLKSNSDVWTGAIWWGGGPWWGTYIYGFEPPSSTGYNYFNSALVQYRP